MPGPADMGTHPTIGLAAAPWGLSRRRSRRSLVGGTSWLLTGITLAALAGAFFLFVVQSIPVWKHEGGGYLTGTRWFFRKETFGAAPMIYGTLAVAIIALLLAAPVGIGAAVFTSEYLPRRMRMGVKLLIELLAGIPSVVYGLLGVLLLRNYVYELMNWMGLEPLSGDSLLTASLLLAIMILPTVMTLADDALQAVPGMQRQAARGLGLTRSQMILSVLLPQAKGGLAAALLLALGRALGETIAVFLVVGRQDNQWPDPLWSPQPLLNAGQTLTSKLGGAETNIAYGDPLHWAAMVGLGLVLLVGVAGVTLAGAVLSGRTERSGQATPAANGSSQDAELSRRTLPAEKTSALPNTGAIISGEGRRRRSVWNRVFGSLMGGCAILSCGVLIWALSAILLRGLPAVSWNFLTEQIRLVGAAGGIFYNLVGTLILIVTAALVAAPLAMAMALVHSMYLPRGSRRRGLTVVLYALNSVPSILFGIVGLIVFVKGLGWGKSWLGGGILLGVMILPTVTVSLIERIKMMPTRYIDAARGLGLSRSQAIRSVVIPQCFGGLITGLLLGLARAAGETAPIMFTATIFAGVSVPHGVVESPVLSLPYHIFILAQDSFDPGVAGKVWGTATVLLGLVFLLNLVALPIRLQVHEEATHAA